jgi:uncharacterized protein YndB with AHSA1/START domain
MADFERTATVSAGPEEAFQFLADPANLPRYVATMRLATPDSGDRLHVAAEVQGRHEEGDTCFRADASRNCIEWGAGEGAGYGGWLQVSPSSGGSSVTIHLHVQHDHDEAEINRVLDETVANIERLLTSA